MSKRPTSGGSDPVSKILDMVGLLLLHPVQFFEAIDLDGPWREPFLFLLPCIVFNAFMNVCLGAGLISKISSLDPEFAALAKDMGAGFYLSAFCVLILSMTVGTFLMSTATTLALHFLGGKGSFQATYRVFACSWIILLVTWIPVLGAVLGMYFFVPAIIGLSRVHSVSRWRAFFGLCIGPPAFTFIASIVIFVLMNVCGFFIHQPGENSIWNRDDELMRRYQAR